MKNTQKVQDALFLFQMAMTVPFCLTELWHMSVNGAAGNSIMMFICFEFFVAINIRLAYNSHRDSPSRATLQNLTIYVTWGILWGLNVALVLWKWLVAHEIVWDRTETVTLGVVLSGLVTILVWRHLAELSKDDPIVRGWRACAFKALPQFFQGVKWFLYGAAGFSGWVVLLGHVTVCTRLALLLFVINEDQDERNRRGSYISEVGNELSWLFATAGWIWWWFTQ